MNSRWSGKRATENNTWHLQRRLMAVAISAVLSGGAWAADAGDAPAKPARLATRVASCCKKWW